MATIKRPVTIGPQTFINFPKLGIQKVPAKVDTGADSSSIWASNISERNGLLSYSLFGPKSPFYTGEIIKTRDFEILSVKNSFGHIEFRYKVKVRIEIENRVLNVRFTLADRSANTFPILIGRRTLHGRFLVDVSDMKTKKRFSVLVFNEKSVNIQPVKQLFNDLGKQLSKTNFILSDYSNLKFVIGESGAKLSLIKPNKKLTDFDLVYFKTSLNSRDTANAVAAYLDVYRVPFLNRSVLQHFSNNKLKQYVMLSAEGIQIPKTYFVSLEHLPGNYSEICRFMGEPFVLKDLLGKKGRNNFLIRNKNDFEKALKTAKKLVIELVAQQYIANEGDYRVLIMGSKVRLIIHRRGSSKTHVNNTSAGANASLVESKLVPPHVQEMCIEAAKIFELDIAGVDIVQDKENGRWYLLEINAGPQLATGAFVDTKEKELVDYLQRKLGKLV